MRTTILLLLLFICISIYGQTDTGGNNIEAKKPHQEVEPLKIGDTAPPFVRVDLHGNMIQLDSLKGNYILLVFGASWCNPCRNENLFLVDLYSETKDKNFIMLTISMDENRGGLIETVKKDGLKWAHLSDSSQEIYKLYHITRIPQTILIDPRGIIVAMNLDNYELVGKLEKCLVKRE